MAGRDTMSIHLPIRPGWTCGACGRPWPCPTRQRELLAEYEGARVSLMLHLAGCFVEASADLPTAAAGALYRRFFGWPGHPPRNARW